MLNPITSEKAPQRAPSTVSGSKKPALSKDIETFLQLLSRISRGEDLAHDEIERIAADKTIKLALRQKASELCEKLRTHRASEGIEGFWTIYDAYQREGILRPEWREIVQANIPPPADGTSETLEDRRLIRGKNGKLVFKTLTEDDIDALPEPQALVAGLLHQVAVSLVFGLSNVGKTFLLIHLAQCIARGIPFFGRKVEQGKVLYIYAEGGAALMLRLRAWRKHFNMPKTQNIEYIGVPTHLIHDREYILNTVEERTPTPRLVIIDTYSMCSSGGDQKDQKDVNLTLNTAREVSASFNCHVSIIHHSNKADDFNGAAEFRNNVDTMIKLQLTNPLTKQVTMSCSKQRDLPYFQDIRLQLNTVDLGVNPATLESVTSCVYTLSNEPATEIQRDEDDKVKMLNILAHHGKQSTSKWKELCKEQGIPERAFDRLSEELEMQESVLVHKPARNGLAKFWEILPQ